MQAKKELQRLQQKAKELSIIPIGDSMTNNLKERENYMIQAMLNLDFDVKSPTIQFYTIKYNI